MSRAHPKYASLVTPPNSRRARNPRVVLFDDVLSHVDEVLSSVISGLALFHLEVRKGGDLCCTVTGQVNNLTVSEYATVCGFEEGDTAEEIAVKELANTTGWTDQSLLSVVHNNPSSVISIGGDNAGAEETLEGVPLGDYNIDISCACPPGHMRRRFKITTVDGDGSISLIASDYDTILPISPPKIIVRPGIKIVITGDSTVTDQSPTFYGGLRPLIHRVDAYYRSKGLQPPTWINSAIGGSYTITWQQPSTYNPAVIDHDPDIVIHHITTNDRRSIDYEDATVMLYKRYVDALFSHNPNLQFGMSSCPFNLEEPLFPDSTWDSMEAGLRQLARERNFPFVALRTHYNNLSPSEQALLTVDGTHPSEVAGRDFWSEHWFNALELRDNAQ